MIASYLKLTVSNVYKFPWKRACVIVFDRFRQDRLAQTAGSLTFTTSIALVPLFTVVLATFTIFPIFGQFQAGIQRWLVESLMPESISRQVLGYMTQFTAKASRLGVAGFAALVISAVVLVLTIDHTLNAIWRVRKPRSWVKRMVLYWSAMTLGPMVVAMGLFLMSMFIGMTGENFPLFTVVWRPVLSALEFLLLAGSIIALYRFVPNTQVQTSHALLGGFSSATALEGARRLLTLYLGKMSTFSVVYGAFATLPILLIWIYTMWVILLIGAVWVSCLPALLQLHVREGSGVGWKFQLSVECLQLLHILQKQNAKGLELYAMAKALRVDPLDLEDVLEKLIEMDWVGLLNEEIKGKLPRYVLISSPTQSLLSDLVRVFLLEPTQETRAVWLRFEGLSLSTILED
jgi:membrane protein